MKVLVSWILFINNSQIYCLFESKLAGLMVIDQGGLLAVGEFVRTISRFALNLVDIAVVTLIKIQDGAFVRTISRLLYICHYIWYINLPWPIFVHGDVKFRVRPITVTFWPFPKSRIGHLRRLNNCYCICHIPLKCFVNSPWHILGYGDINIRVRSLTHNPGGSLCRGYISDTSGWRWYCNRFRVCVCLTIRITRKL